MIVQVTQDDIDRGTPNCSWTCPIAIALHRRTGQWWKVACFRAENLDGGRVVLPEAAQLFEYDYDNGRPVQPFEFEVSDK